MGLFQPLKGFVQIEVVSADVSGLLSQLCEKNISLDNLQSIDEMTFYAKVSRKDIKALGELINRRGDKLSVINKEGIYWLGKTLLARPFFIAGLAVLLLLSLFLPSRILFVRVSGNSSVPSKLILQMADECGISMFASRRKVRSEKVKNALLEKVPELQWVGVNTSGCVATISVTEKSANTQEDERPLNISSIVASRDGIIWECTVLRGNPVCKVGQAVKSGQTLISGYTDCGITIKATRAEGEIFARTFRELELITPINTLKRENCQSQKTNFSLLFGKKLIKLYKGSGISDGSCVKIYDEIVLTLPGGFQLPVALIRESISVYNFTETDYTEEYNWLSEAAVDYLETQMIAGQIMDQNVQIESLDKVCRLNGQFGCLEMIGQDKTEEIIQR